MRKIYPKSVVFIAVTLALGAPSTGFSDSSSETSFSKRWYIGAGVGQSKLQPKPTTSATSISEDRGDSFSFHIGRDLSPRFTLDAYISSLGEADIDFMGTPVGGIDYSVYGVSLLGYLFNSRADGLFFREGLSPYLRLGVGGLENSSDVVEYKREHAAHLALGVGLEYGWSSGLALRTEYSAYDKDAQQFSLSLIKRFGESSYASSPAALPAAASTTGVNASDTLTASPSPVDLDPPLVFFDYDADDLTQESIVSLDRLVEILNKHPEVAVQIDGHTDSVGGEDYNVDLAMSRADSVFQLLVDAGVAPSRLSTATYGEEQPIANNDSDAGRARNRRVEISRKN